VPAVGVVTAAGGDDREPRLAEQRELGLRLSRGNYWSVRPGIGSARAEIDRIAPS
jgi:hypothetical protein